MNVRRFEHPTKHRFWEVYWDVLDVETVSGAIGSNGRASRKEFRSHVDCTDYVANEVRKRVEQGFEEVVPEVIQNQHAPQVTPPPELLARILEAPDDDQPRMVYADWLHQHGDPLGELVAVQLEIARHDPFAPVPKALRDREENLLGNFRQRWLPNVVGVDVKFVRGFVDEVKLEPPFQRDVLDRIVEAAPLLRTLVIAQPRQAWPTTGRHPWDFASPHALSRLWGLVMGGIALEEAAVRAFANLDMPRLERLGMRSMQLRPSTIKPILARDWVELDFHQNALGARGVGFLIDHDRTRLAKLDLGSNDIGNAGLQLLVQGKLPALTHLSLRRSNLAPNGMKLLSQLPALVSLDLSHNRIAGTFDFTLPRLRELDLRDTELDDPGLRRLAASPLATQLAVLDLGGNKLTDPAPLRAFPALRWLNVSNTPLAKDRKSIDAVVGPVTRVVARTRAARI